MKNLQVNWISSLFLLPFIVLVSSFLWSSLAQAGCPIDLTVKNVGTSLISLHANESKVKVRKRTWKLLARPLRSNWLGMKKYDLEAGESQQAVYRGTFRCKVRRRYQIHYYCQTGPHKGKKVIQYFPSSRGEWDKSRELLIPLTRCD